MTVEDLIIYGKSKVTSQHAKMLLADLLNLNSLELLNCLSEPVSSRIEEEYKNKIEKLSKNYPIQYIIGNVNFYGYQFIVNENVLIPRFETEELVENTLELMKKYFPNAKSIIDLGTGSGAIGITIKKKTDTQVTLVDISKAALEVAKENAIALDAEVNLIESDMWENVPGRYDVIISNPPYIKEQEEIQSLVEKNEPHLALYAGPDGLDCYRKILKDIQKHINENYLIAFEIGETQKEAVITLMKEQLPQATIIAKKDLQGRDRMIFAYEKNI